MEYSISPSQMSEHHISQKIYQDDMDLSCKLFLIKKAIEKQGKKKLNTAVLSEAIFIDSGVSISPNECKKIIKNYTFLIKKSYKYETILTCISIFYALHMSGNYSLMGVFFLFLSAPLLFSFFYELFLCASLLFFNPKKLMPDIVVDEDKLKSTAIVIASRNEPFFVAKMTFDSALSLNYPNNKKEIIIVDNSDVTFSEYDKWKKYVESYADNGFRKIENLRVIFIHRDGVEGFKPQNLDIALNQVSSEFILYLDVDSTVHENTLLRIVPILNREPSLGFVQLQSIPSNAKGASPLALIQGLSSYFLRLTTAINAHASHSLFYGHNAVWRTKVVREIGSCLEYHNDETIVTEDLSMSLRARFIGYHGVTAWVESGEWVPESMRETEAMWLRWTVGTYQVYAKHLLTFKNIKKFNFHEIIGWLHHVISLTNSALVPLYIGFGLLFKSTILMWIATISFFPEIVLCICAYLKLPLDNMRLAKKVWACYSSFFILSSFINWVKLNGLIRYILGKKQGWIPTSKTTGSEISFLEIVLNHRFLIIYGFFCIALSTFLMIHSTMLNFILILVCQFYGVNCLLSIYLFGKSRMEETPFEAVEKGHVNHFSGFYLK